MDLPPGRKLKAPIIPSLAKARTDLASVIGKLHASLKSATIEAGDYSRAKDDPDESFFSHHVRYLTRVQLRQEGIDAEEEDYGLEQTSNTGICITQPDYLIRVLRETIPGSLPPPGDSERRKRFFAQQSEQLPLKYEDDGIDVIDGREPVHIVVLWTSDQERKYRGIWVICPNGVTDAPFFQEFLPVPELQDLGITATTALPEEEPPTDLGMTRKDRPKEQDQSKPKTGTESDDK